MCVCLITYIILEKGPMHKPTLHQTTSNQSANIYSSLTNACKKQGTKKFKKISSCESAAPGLEKDAGQKSSKRGGGHESDNQLEHRQLCGEEGKLKKRYTVGNF